MINLYVIHTRNTYTYVYIFLDRVSNNRNLDGEQMETKIHFINSYFMDNRRCYGYITRYDPYHVYENICTDNVRKTSINGRKTVTKPWLQQLENGSETWTIYRVVLNHKQVGIIYHSYT